MINHRLLRSKLGSRSARRQGTKHGKSLKPRARTKLSVLVEKAKLELLQVK